MTGSPSPFTMDFAIALRRAVLALVARADHFDLQDLEAGEAGDDVARVVREARREVEA